MMRENIRFLLQIILFLLSVSYGSGVRCYICSSMSEPRCTDPLRVSDDGRPMQTQECTPDIVQHTVNSLNRAMSTLGNTLGFDVHEQDYSFFQCQKIDVWFNGQKSVIRGCTLAKTERRDPCIEQARNYIDQSNIMYCGLCNGDGCNGANSLKQISTLHRLVILSIVFITSTFIL